MICICSASEGIPSSWAMAPGSVRAYLKVAFRIFSGSAGPYAITAP